MKKNILVFACWTISLCLNLCIAQNHVNLVIEDFNNQIPLNNLSGNGGQWTTNSATLTTQFDTADTRNAKGACFKVSYMVSQPTNDAFIWSSLINERTLNFSDLYDELKNSSGNPVKVEDIRIDSFSFWAKGDGMGRHSHSIKVELKNTLNQKIEKTFLISNTATWHKYTFPIPTSGSVDLTVMKELVFVILGSNNSHGTGKLYIDDLTLETSQNSFDISTWSDDQFLDLISQRQFQYFLLFVDSLGFALDQSSTSELVSIGGIGYQLGAYCIGNQRDWADGLEARVEQIIRNLAQLSMGPDSGLVHAGHKGFFYHFLEANKGTRKDSKVELSTYDTMLLMYGLLSSKAEFPHNQTIDSLSRKLFDAVQWDWMVDTDSLLQGGNPNPNFNQFRLGWKPEGGGEFLTHIDNYTDEALLVDILALGSKTHPISLKTHHARRRNSLNTNVYPSNSNDSIVAAWSGSMFNYFFASSWLNLECRGEDNHPAKPINIWENNRRAIIANYQFCQDHADTTKGDGDFLFETYKKWVWGLSACHNLAPYLSGLLHQYFAFGAEPTEQKSRFGTLAPHVGTITTYAPASSIVFIPDTAIQTLKYLYLHTPLWNPLFGLGDGYSSDPHYFELTSDNQPKYDTQGNLIIHPALHLNGDWTNWNFVAINQGPGLLSIENYRSQGIWKLTDSCEYIKKGMDMIFGICTAISNDNGSTLPGEDQLVVYPNPSSGMIYISVPSGERPQQISLFTLEGKTISTQQPVNQSYSISVPLDISTLPSGIYLLEVLTKKGKLQKKVSLRK